MSEITREEQALLAVLRERRVDVAVLTRALDTDAMLASGAVKVRRWAMQCPKCLSGATWDAGEGTPSWTLDAGLLGLRDPCTCGVEAWRLTATFGGHHGNG